MVHTVEVIAPHFRLKLFSQNRTIRFAMQNVNPDIHEISLKKVSSGPFTDLFGKNATLIHMPRDSSGRVEIQVSFRPPAGDQRNQTLWEYLGYKVVVRHKQLSLSAVRQDTYTWNLNDIRGAQFDITSSVSSRVLVQLDAPLSLEKNESSVIVPVRKAYATLPSVQLEAGSQIAVYMAPRQTFLDSGAYVAGEFFARDDSAPELTYKLP